MFDHYAVLWTGGLNAFSGYGVVFLGLVMLFIGIGRFVWGARLRNAIEREVEASTRNLELVGRRYRLMVDNAYDLMAVTDADGRIDYVNSAYTRILGYGRDDLRGVVWDSLVHPRDIEEFRLARTAMLSGTSGGQVSEVALRLRHANGNWVHVEAVAKGLPDSDWVMRHIVVHSRDVSARKKVGEDLARSEQRFRDFAASSADWLWEVDDKLNFTYVSPGVIHVMGYDPDELLGRYQFDMLFEQEGDRVQELMDSRIGNRQPYRDLELSTKTRHGDRVWLRISGVPVFDENQQFRGYRGAASNISADKARQENIYRLATTDHLTKLLNRPRFKEELDRALNLARRHHTGGVVLFIDLDRFKEINDSHGHEAGDQILVGVSQILRDAVRSTDVVSRLGGDEFAIIMHNIDIPTATEKVQNIIDRVSAFNVDYNGARLSVTMSVGMVQYPQDDKGVEHLLMSADLAMYKAKDMGRNRLFVEEADDDGETQNSVKAQLKWVDRLRVCMETGDFEMHYQAIVPTEPRGRPLFEALLRIYDENGKVASPALYIDAAEHFGLIQQLDMAVVKRVFETQLDMMSRGVDYDVSINLSCRTLGDPDVTERLKELMTTHPVDPSRIIFEVTETMALHDPAQMRDIGEIHAFITELRKLGFRFALDDFGTGFTSFRYLKVLKVDVVKIDGEYIKDLETSAEDLMFVKSMADLCKGLGIQTIAEFVENERIMKILVELGVDYGQGWHFAKPMPDLPNLVKTFGGRVMGEFNCPTKEVAALLAKPKGKAEHVADVAKAVEEHTKANKVAAKASKTAVMRSGAPKGRRTSSGATKA